MNEQSPQEFYDRFTGKLISDYVYGNKRAEAAIQHALHWIPSGCKRILDIGCGIGWRSWEIKKEHPSAFILGIDLSEGSIKTAQKLFSQEDLQFTQKDLVNWKTVGVDPFDVIVLLDIYEHINKQNRENIYHKLLSVLGENGRVILSFPSVSHQNYLRNRFPQGLQPIDEDVTEEDISILAKDLGLKVLHFEHVDIWRPKDYVHVVLGKDHGVQPRSISNKIESSQERADRIRNNLSCRITPNGVLLPIIGENATCIIAPNADQYSETFIRSHAERLPTTIRFLNGDAYSFIRDDGKPLLPILPLRRRAIRYVLRRGLGLDENHFSERAFIKFVRESKIKAVLAEYGQTGVAVMDVCNRAKIPLIVHFHGYDAYSQPVINAYSEKYAQLFQQCAAIIAVSQSMMKQLIALGAPEKKIYLNPYGVDLSLFNKSDTENSPPLFVAVGRFVDKKAPHLTLLAFEKVLRSFHDARLIMVGEGSLQESCKQLSTVLKIDKYVSFPGALPHETVAQLLRNARGFIQHSIRTSYGDMEGTPVAILEAGASGLPVVSTKHGGITEAVIRNQTGFLVEEGDVEGMAEYILKLARDPKLAGTMGSAARTHIQSNYSMDKSIANLWSIIENAINGRSQRNI